MFPSVKGAKVSPGLTVGADTMSDDDTPIPARSPIAAAREQLGENCFDSVHGETNDTTNSHDGHAVPIVADVLLPVDGEPLRSDRHSAPTDDEMLLTDAEPQQPNVSATQIVDKTPSVMQPKGFKRFKSSNRTVVPLDEDAPKKKRLSAAPLGGLIKRKSTRVQDPEGLGPDFEDQPFAKPDTEEAHAYGSHHRFLEGKGRLWVTPVSEFGSMGVGMALYFLFLKYIAVLMLFLSILTLPSAIMFWYGNGVLTEELGPLNLAGSTVANLGDRDGSGIISNNPDVEPLFGPDSQLTQLQASYLISLLDFICGIAIFVFTFIFKRRIKKTIEQCERKFVSAGDYSIMVRGLPRDATANEIRAHFDALYQLSEPDWTSPGTCCGCIGKKKARQPGIPGQKGLPKPCQDASHSLDDCTGSWCAEVSVAFNDGEFIRLFQRLKKHNAKLRRTRAKIKYLSNLVEPTEAIKRKEVKARALLVKAEQKFKFLENSVSKMQRRAKNAEQECVAAFVIFNHEESLLRCLRDYVHDARWWRKQPKQIRFRGIHPLKIQIAAEPSNVKWENLGESYRSLLLRRVLNNTVTLVMLLVSLSLIYAAQTYKNEYQDNRPDLTICASDLPATSIAYTDPRLETATLERNRKYDQLCSGNESYWLSFVDSTNVSASFDLSYDLLTNPELLAEHQGVDGVIKTTFDTSVFDPCQNPCVSVSETAPAVTCFTKSIEEGCPSTTNISPTCPTSEEGNMTFVNAELDGVCCKEYNHDLLMAGCYCLAAFQEATSEKGLFKALNFLYETEGDFCTSFASSMLVANGLVMLAVVVVLAVNMILKRMLKVLGIVERHQTVSEEISSITMKIFLAQFMNTALVVLLVNGRLPDQIENPLKSFRLLDGKFNDFSVNWFTVVGVAVVLTMFINTIAPHIAPMANSCIVNPLKKRWQRRSALTQQDLNRTHTGDEFNLDLRFPLILNTLFVTLFYAGPMPVLWPLACLAFLLYFWIDKYSVLFLYRIPPQYDASLAFLAVKLMPYGLLMHFGISFWAFGNPEFMSSNEVDIRWLRNITGIAISDEFIDQFYQGADTLQDLDPVGFITKARRTVAAPHLLIALCLIAFLTLDALLGNTFRGLVTRILDVLFCRCCFHRFEHRANNPPYTGKYSQEVPPDFHLSAARMREGWKIINNENDGTKIQEKIWTKTGTIDQVEHFKGDNMLTWEVIQSNSLHTYRIEANRKYADAMRAYKSASSRPASLAALKKVDSDKGPSSEKIILVEDEASIGPQQQLGDGSLNVENQIDIDPQLEGNETKHNDIDNGAIVHDQFQFETTEQGHIGENGEWTGYNEAGEWVGGYHQNSDPHADWHGDGGMEQKYGSLQDVYTHGEYTPADYSQVQHAQSFPQAAHHVQEGYGDDEYSESHQEYQHEQGEQHEVKNQQEQKYQGSEQEQGNGQIEQEQMYQQEQGEGQQHGSQVEDEEKGDKNSKGIDKN